MRARLTQEQIDENNKKFEIILQDYNMFMMSNRERVFYLDPIHDKEDEDNNELPYKASPWIVKEVIKSKIKYLFLDLLHNFGIKRY